MPVVRVGRGEEVADAVLFLMKNGFVTGITLTRDGGVLTSNRKLLVDTAADLSACWVARDDW